MAIVLAVLTLTLLAVSGVSRTVLWSLVALAVIGGFGIGEFHLLKPYQQARFTSFIHPAAADPGGVAYQTQQAEAAIGGGGLTGEGFLKGQLTNGRFIPEQQTDFAFTVAAEETGLAGASVVLVLLGGLSLRALRIAARAPDRYGRLVAAGIGTWFGVQTFVDVGMTLGIMPVTGLPLPFVSYGGSALFCSLIAVGILLAVDARSEPA